MTTEIAASDKLNPEHQTAMDSDREYKLPPDQKGSKVMDYTMDPRFKGINPFPSRVWLSSPTMHGDEQRYVDDRLIYINLNKEVVLLPCSGYQKFIAIGVLQ